LKELYRSVEVVTTPGRPSHSRLASSSKAPPPGTTLYEALLEIKRLGEENRTLRIEVERLQPLDTVNETLRAENATLRETNDAFQVKEEVYKYEVEKWQGEKRPLHGDQILSVTVTLQAVPSGAKTSTGTTELGSSVVSQTINSMHWRHQLEGFQVPRHIGKKEMKARRRSEKEWEETSNMGSITGKAFRTQSG
jgi:FtsZ-binding cell division protein ZapB